MEQHEQKVYARIERLKKKLGQSEERANEILQILDNSMTKTLTKAPEIILWENKAK